MEEELLCDPDLMVFLHRIIFTPGNVVDSLTYFRESPGHYEVVGGLDGPYRVVEVMDVAGSGHPQFLRIETVDGREVKPTWAKLPFWHSGGCFFLVKPS